MNKKSLIVVGLLLLILLSLFVFAKLDVIFSKKTGDKDYKVVDGLVEEWTLTKIIDVGKLEKIKDDFEKMKIDLENTDDYYDSCVKNCFNDCDSTYELDKNFIDKDFVPDCYYICETNCKGEVYLEIYSMRIMIDKTNEKISKLEKFK